MRIYSKDDVGYIFIYVVDECLFATWMQVHEVGEVKYHILIEEQILIRFFGKGYPLICSLH